MTKYIRIKSGEASFQLVERFDEVEKAANPNAQGEYVECKVCLLYTSPSPRDGLLSRMPSSA